MEQIAYSQRQPSRNEVGRGENQFEHMWNIQRGELSGLSGNP
jgi:hypothetical protein